MSLKPVYIIPTKSSGIDIADALLHVIQDEVNTFQAEYSWGISGESIDLFGRESADSIGYGLGFSVPSDHSTDGFHLDIEMRADLLSLSIDDAVDSSANLVETPCVWIEGNLSKVENGSETWLYYDSVNQTHLRSVDIGIGWGPNCGWQFRGDLNDARFDGHRDVLDTVRNRLRLKNGQDIPPGFYELVNRFLESHTYDEMSMTALDYVMKALESIGISSHSSDTWQIDLPAITTLVDQTEDFFQSMLYSTSGGWDLGPICEAIGNIPNYAGLSLTANQVCRNCGENFSIGASCSCGSTLSSYNLTLSLLPPLVSNDTDFKFELTSEGRFSINLDNWKPLPDLGFCLNMSMQLDQLDTCPNVNFRINFGDSSSGPLNHGSLEFIFAPNSVDGSLSLDVDLLLPGITRLPVFDATTLSFNWSSYPDRISLFSNSGSVSINPLVVLQEIGPYFAIQSLVQSTLDEFLFD